MVVVLVFYSVFYWRHIWVLQKKYELFEIELSSIFKMIFVWNGIILTQYVNVIWKAPEGAET